MAERNRSFPAQSLKLFLLFIGDAPALHRLLDGLVVGPQIQPSIPDYRQRLLILLGQSRGKIPGRVFDS